MKQLIENIGKLNFDFSENKAHVNFDVSENINGLKNQSVKNDYFIADINGEQVIENKVQPNFGLNENIGGLKNQSVKNGRMPRFKYGSLLRYNARCRLDWFVKNV